MASEGVRHAVWNGLLDVNRQARYYGVQSGRYNTWSTRLTVVFAMVGSADVASVLAAADHRVGMALALLIGILAVVASVGDFAKKAAVLHSIGLECDHLASEWEELWVGTHSGKLSDSTALTRNQELIRRLIAATNRAGQSGVRENRKVNKKCWIEACMMLENKYA